MIIPELPVQTSPTVSPQYMHVVHVVDPDTDQRPAGNSTMWVGGTTQPVNMVTGDIWLKAV